MGNASWGPKRRFPQPVLLTRDPTPEDHPALIVQARLDRMTRPNTLYLSELIRWEREFRNLDSDLLEAMLAELTPQVTALMGTVRNPPSWYTLANWQAAAKTLDEKQARLDAATRLLGRRE